MKTPVLTMLLVLLLLDGAAVGDNPQAQEGRDYVRLRVARLACVIGNNRALDVHRGRYNGIFQMTSPDQEESPYVPLYAGINLENFFDARPRHPNANVFFEPRCHPMKLTRINATTVELHQAATPYFGIESRMRFQLKPPYYMDYTYTCIPHRADLAGKFFGVFWASYIHGPDNKSVYFLGKGARLDHPFWEQMLSQQHDRDSTLRGETDRVTLNFQGTSPALWRSCSPLRYSAPFFYGRFRNMVLIYIFKPGPTIRFAHSPSGGGIAPKYDQHNPAWDFQLIVPDYQVNRPYDLAMRLVYKPWSGRADVLNQVRHYLAGSNEKQIR